MKYRYLKVGDAIQKGDEFFSDGEWEKTEFFYKVNSKELKYRRPIKSKPKKRVFVGNGEHTEYKYKAPKSNITDKQRIDFVQRNEATVDCNRSSRWYCYSYGDSLIQGQVSWRKAVDKAMKEWGKK